MTTEEMLRQCECLGQLAHGPTSETVLEDPCTVRLPTRKREVYARAATQLRTHERAFAAEAACPGAMGLYLFCLLHARGEETDGTIRRMAARDP